MTEPRSQLAAISSEATCREKAETFLHRLETIEPTLRAFVDVQPDRLRREADELDRLAPENRGPLYGQLVAVKEIFDVAGYRCSWGTKIHHNRIPQTDSVAVQRLKSADALIAGVTVSTEYAIARTGPTTNPHDPARTPGASSQGSAAAVGAGLVDFAIGSQTIGSIIRPAAYCGTVGFKPTWNICSLDGVMPLSPTLDHIGLITDNPENMERLFATLSVQTTSQANPGKVRRLLPWFDDTVSEVVGEAQRQALSFLSGIYGKAEDLVLPDETGSRETLLVETILAAEMACCHKDDFDNSSDLMSDRVRSLIRRGRTVSPDEIETAREQRCRMSKQLDRLIGNDILIMPATLDTAPLLSEGTGSRAPQRIWSLTGQPSLTVPVLRHDGLPVGVQLVAARRQDQRLIEAAKQLHQACRF